MIFLFSRGFKGIRKLKEKQSDPSEFRELFLTNVVQELRKIQKKETNREKSLP